MNKYRIRKAYIPGWGWMYSAEVKVLWFWCPLMWKKGGWRKTRGGALSDIEEDKLARSPDEVSAP